VSDVRVVINYDMCGGNRPGHPDNVESYVHRIGRTARGGQGGVAYTFFVNADRNNAEELIKLLSQAGQEVPEALQLMGGRV
jgi:superfamily II DNA/RNA helicase